MHSVFKMCSRMNFWSVPNFSLLVVLINMTLTACAAIESNDSSSVKLQEYQNNVCDGKPLCNLTVILPKEGYYKCMCDSNCSTFGDCCPDSQYQQISKTQPNVNQTFSCDKKFKYYMVNKCPLNFSEVETKMKCENVSFEYDYEDLKIMKPVMDTVSRITYRNAYCAICNGVTRYENFRSTFNCTTNRPIQQHMKDSEKFQLLTQVLNNVKFNNDTKLFTSVYNGTEYNCSYRVVTPSHMEPYLRFCEPKLISSCPREFNDSAVREKCLSTSYVVYSSFLRGSGDVYKNAYCAQCNGVEDTNLLYQCQDLGGTSKRTYASSLFQLSPSPGVGDVCDDPNLNQVLVC